LNQHHETSNTKVTSVNKPEQKTEKKIETKKELKSEKNDNDELNAII